MKVLMVNKFLYPNGGSETYIFKIGEQLQKLGHEVQYFGMEHEGRIVGNHAECYTQGMDFHTGKLQKLLYPFKIIYSFEAKNKMLLVMKDFQPDVVHLNNINFQLTPSVIDAVTKYEKQTGRKVRIVFTAHDYQWICPNHMMHREKKSEEQNLDNPKSKYCNCEKCVGGKFSNCTTYRCIHGSRVKSILGSMEAYFYQMRKTYGKVDTIICPSLFMQEKINTNPLLASKTVMLRNFIEKKEAVLQPNEKTQNQSDKDSSKKEKQDYVLYFGRYAEEKGIQTLLEVCKRCPDIRFVFAGNGPLEEQVNRIKNIENVGFQKGDSLQQYIKNARFSIYPSEWYENGPFSIMESIQAGTPVIGAEIGGIPELIQDDKTGILYESGQEDALYQAVNLLWQDREKNDILRMNCQKETYWTVEEYCDKLMQYYK